jgi:phosphoglycerate dehydrogenase-like enzyme
MTETWDILVPSIIDEEALSIVEDFAEIYTYDADCTPSELLEEIEVCEAFVHRTVPVDERILDRAEALQIISKHGVGVDLIDVDAASERGIFVCNTPGANARAVGEMAITLLLAAWKELLPADESVRTGRWEEERHRGNRSSIPNVEGATLGVYGCGNIGAETCSIAQGIGMSCLGFDPYVSAEEMPDGVEKVDSKPEFFERADAVSVHVPITPETRGAVGADELDRLGPDGIVVNAARGGAVDEAALLEALEEGWIRGAGLDVFEQEPPSTDNPLLERDDVVLSPHVAGASSDSYRQMGQQALWNVRIVHEGGIPESTVNTDRIADGS